jgi:ribosome-interacting GTPase 1|tara:strand:+ start:1009 stop:1326 length:318 start_codon:yes stop_codon:yes gene_type:complete
LSSDSSFDDPQAASYEFTTLTCVPGIKYWKGAKIQLLDLPGIIEGAKDGKGRGRQVIGVARTCSCIIIVLDAMKSMEQAQVESKKRTRTRRRRKDEESRAISVPC